MSKYRVKRSDAILLCTGNKAAYCATCARFRQAMVVDSDKLTVLWLAIKPAIDQKCLSHYPKTNAQGDYFAL